MVFGAKRLPQIIRCGFALLAPRIDIKRGKPLIGDAGAATIRQAGTVYALLGFTCSETVLIWAN
jgi:hypothetical protein